MAYAPPLRERVLIGDLTEPENDYISASVNSLRPTKYKEWSEERMKLAMQAVLEKDVSIRTAAEIYRVPKSTLGDRISGRVLPGMTSGPARYLSQREEEELVTFLCRTSSIGYGRCRKEVISLVERILLARGERKKVTNGWWQKFLKRYPQLTLRTPAALSYSRVHAADQDSINAYFDILEETLEENDLTSQPCRIFNVDETGLSLNPSSLKTVHVKGQKNPSQCSSGNRGQITVVGCVSAGGQIIPPMVIWNRKTVPAQLAQMECPGTIYGLSTKGWIDQKLFDLWFRKHFLRYAPTDRPLLLLLDGHSSHYCPDTIKLAAEEGVIVFTIPPHSSHITQPLDKGLYGPLKVAWKQICHDHLITNPGASIGKHNFSRLLSQAWLQSMSPKNAIAGFKTTGVYPPNRNAIKLVEDTPTLSGKHGIAYIPLYTPIKRKAPQPASQSTPESSEEELMQNPVVPTEDSTSESSNSSITDGFGDSFGAAGIYKSTISGFLEIPTPPKPSKVPEQSVSSRVLTSVENLQRIKEKEKEAQEKARLKEERAKKREEKKKAKLSKGIKCRSTKTTKNGVSGCQLDDSLFTLGDNTSEEDGESTASSRQITQEKSKEGCRNDSKRRREKEVNTKTDSHTSVKGTASSRARKGKICDSNFIDDDRREEKVPKLTQAKSKVGTLRRRMGREKTSQVNSGGASNYTTTSRDNPVVSSENILFMFDDHTPEKARISAEVARKRQNLDSGNCSTSNKGASGVSIMTEQDPDISQLNFSESSSDGDAETDIDSESEGKRQKPMPKQKGKRKTLMPKASVSARNIPSKISNRQNQRSRMITIGNEDQLVVSTDNSKVKKNKDCKSGIKTSSLTKGRGLSSHKSKEGKSSTSHLSQDERDKISAQKEEVASGRLTRLKVKFHDVVSDQQEREVTQQQDDDKLTKTLSKVGKNAAPKKNCRGREREASKAGRSLTNNSVGEITHMRDDTEKLGENLILLSSKVRSARVKSRTNGKHDPSIPAQQDQHVPPQKGKLLLEEREHDQMSKRELQKPFFEPRVTRAMRKLAQDKENKTASTKLKGSQLEHTLSDSGGTLHFLSDFADITDDLILDSSLFSYGDLSDIEDGEKSIEKDRSMDGEPIIIESGDSESSFESQTWWIKALYLADTDHQALVSGGELSDSLIMAAQTMLASQYPEIRGLQDTNKGRYLTFSGVSRNCVQIFYVDDLRHWVCTTSVNTNKDSDVYVMDSLGGVFPLSPSLRQQIVKVYGGKRSQLIIRRLSVQQQVGATDCGLFAVAFAVEVCHGNDPSRVSYDQSKMRSHFTSCLQKGHLDTFPRGRKSQENIPRSKGQSVSIPVLAKAACRSRSSSKR